MHHSASRSSRYRGPRAFRLVGFAALVLLVCYRRFLTKRDWRVKRLAQLAPGDALERLASLPIYSWKYRFQPTVPLERYEREQPWGLATSVDLYRCNPDLIRSAEHIRAFVEQLCQLIKMKRFGETDVVDFGEDPRVSGFSMTQLIETSLVSGHFANQSNAAYLDIFSCKAYPPYVAATFARVFFEAQEARVTASFRR